MDQMMDIMEKYANNLEDLVNQRTNEVYEEKRKTEDLLHRMLPAYVFAGVCLIIIFVPRETYRAHASLHFIA